MILAHHEPAMLARLVDRLQHPDVFFVVHIDARSNQRPFRTALSRHANLRFISDADTGCGSITSASRPFAPSSPCCIKHMRVALIASSTFQGRIIR
ncbi:hypothetical protein [uncultured Sphingomonas sp.]|uniref:hypothetical protein n=1 Tax=uncultured Sphingomonas sp. TaxID=158754 RepID=UPI0035CC6B8A